MVRKCPRCHIGKPSDEFKRSDICSACRREVEDPEGSREGAVLETVEDLETSKVEVRWGKCPHGIPNPGPCGICEIGAAEGD